MKTSIFDHYDITEAGYQYATQGKVDATTKAALVADAAAIFVPFATGAGLAVRGGAKAASKTAEVSKGLKNAAAIKEGKDFELAALKAAEARGENVVDQVRLVPKNGIGNIKGNRSNVDQLIKKDDGNYKVVETKLRQGTSELSTGQKSVKEHTLSKEKKFEVRSRVDKMGLNKGNEIVVDEYQVIYKYE